MKGDKRPENIQVSYKKKSNVTVIVEAYIFSTANYA